VERILLEQAREHLIDPSRMEAGQVNGDRPLGFLDLERCPAEIRLPALPPWPLIGLGDRAHPLARSLDAILEPPVSVEALIRGCERAPHAAAIAVQLLRSLQDVPCERALMLESFCYGLLQGSAEHAEWLASRALPAQRLPAGRLIVERHDSTVLIAMDRPAARNAIDRAMRDQLFEAFSLTALDTEVQTVKLRAVGTVFSTGGDLDEFGTTRDPAMAHMIRSRTLPAVAIAPRARILDVHVQGACIGAGLEIAAFAGRLTAEPDAWFQLPELSMGLIPGAGGCVSVPRRIGRQRAALMILSGRRINAKAAFRWGLIDGIASSTPTAHEPRMRSART
jgi:enoyl-CoA hydratase